MEEMYSMPMMQIVRNFKLDTVTVPKDIEERRIVSRDINRPGLCLTGFFGHFDEKRIQIIGKAENEYLESMDIDTRRARVRDFFEHKPPMVIFTIGKEIDASFLELAREYDIPVFQSKEKSSEFTAALIAYLNVQLGPRITRHGVLVEVYGEGVLILGDSGIGKSETAIELVKRGHRLIADDAVEIRKVSSKSLVGSAPENIRHFIELRGIGIVNVRRIFGIGSVKLTEKIDMIVNLEAWDANKVYDRMGLESEKTNILGLDIVSVSIPVKPGRNLAVVIEVAAMNNRQKKMGYNAAAELLEKLGMNDAGPETGKSEVEPF